MSGRQVAGPRVARRCSMPARMLPQVQILAHFWMVPTRAEVPCRPRPGQVHDPGHWIYLMYLSIIERAKFRLSLLVQSDWASVLVAHFMGSSRVASKLCFEPFNPSRSSPAFSYVQYSHSVLHSLLHTVTCTKQCGALPSFYLLLISRVFR